MKSGHARAPSADGAQSAGDASRATNELAIADDPMVRQDELRRSQGGPERPKPRQKRGQR